MGFEIEGAAAVDKRRPQHQGCFHRTQEEWMFCIACGRQMSDEARFCSQCGTRRAVIPTDAANSVPTSPARTEQPPSVAPPAALRPIRSTAEIMPIRVPQAAAAPPAAVQPAEPSHSVVPWPEEENASPTLISAPEPPTVVEPAAMRPSASERSAYADEPTRAAEGPRADGCA